MPDRLPCPDLPADVRACVDAVLSAGAPLFTVGGAVRDRMLGLPVDDFDFATPLHPEVVREVLAARGRCAGIDAVLGRVATSAAGGEVVFTTLRRESDYGLDRRPAHVQFVTSPADDAARRDFTVNAIYQDVLTGQLVDPVGGIADLAARTLRVIGDARVRLHEDPLRILRAIRFEASRGLIPSPNTFAALAECAVGVGQLSGNRRFEELQQILTGVGAVFAVERVLDLGILGTLLPVLEGCEARVRRALVPFLARRAASAAGAFAVLFGERADAALGLRALGAPRSLRRSRRGGRGARRGVLEAHGQNAAARALASLEAQELQDLSTWNEIEPAGRWTIDEILARGGDAPELPTGTDVLALGVPPGPGVGDVLRAVGQAIDEAGECDASRIRDILVREAAAWIKRSGQAGR
ncbi:MAG: CCA tRNA nucleotidyltransferase [Planctomycetota bacterium]